jgi:hypothetical protein
MKSVHQVYCFELQEVCKYIKDEQLLAGAAGGTPLPYSPLELQEYLFLYQEDEEFLKRNIRCLCKLVCTSKKGRNEQEYIYGYLQSPDIQDGLPEIWFKSCL